MNRKDIIRMAREAGFTVRKDGEADEVMDGDNRHIQIELVEKFARLVSAFEREMVAQWMMYFGYATEHDDTIEDLLTRLNWQTIERVAERCIQLCDQVDFVGADKCIDNIREYFGMDE